ncbi:hypothetical protein PG994_002834 [Apiospora phragmitis]|uniref:Uncharacterized protein n=1 Tax=Apiospora phragmitis TaxID=2905665 RepID=A0ABR1W7I7_9PEZI
MRFTLLATFLAAASAPAACAPQHNGAIAEQQHSNMTEIEFVDEADKTTFQTRLCNKGRRPRKYRVWQGVDYLAKIEHERPIVSVGCGPAPVSCSFDAAIWLCGSTYERIELRNFGVVAAGAAVVLRECSFRNNERVSGEAYVPDRFGAWYVKVTQPDGHC